jgi:ABC-2 type transport system ATP-binding protein
MSAEAPQIEEETVRVPVEQRAGAIMEAVRRLDDAGVGVEDLGVRRPTLDEVFLALTGREAVSTQERDGERGDGAGGEAPAETGVTA